MMRIIMREEWGAAPPRGQFPKMLKPQGIVIHHSAGSARHVSDIAGIQRDHQECRGWLDIGYNFIIPVSGEVCEGRPEIDGMPVHGAHTPGMNSSRVGICFLGDFSGGKDWPSGRQVSGFVAAVQYCAIRYGINPIRLEGHRDHRPTECPGHKLYRMLDIVKEMARQPFVALIEVE